MKKNYLFQLVVFKTHAIVKQFIVSLVYHKHLPEAVTGMCSLKSI